VAPAGPRKRLQRREGPWAQARSAARSNRWRSPPHPDRRRRPTARGRGPRRRHLGSQRRQGRAEAVPPVVSLRADRVRGWRLRRAPRRMAEGQGQRHAGDRQAHALDEGLRRHPPSMGRRADRSLQYEVPLPCAGLRATRSSRRSSHHHRSIRNTPQAMGMTLLKHGLSCTPFVTRTASH
jgi:hypothetical protein